MAYRVPLSQEKIDAMCAAYVGLRSCTDLAKEYGVSPNTVLRWVMRKGLPIHSKAIQCSIAGPKRGQKLRGVARGPMSQETRNKLSKVAIARADLNSKGITIKPRGHIEYTRGENAQRGVHVVLMEQRLGRRLLKDECVHHIDGDPGNNNLNNLALMTNAAHGRIHRLMDKWRGIVRPRDKTGRFLKEKK